MSQTTEKVKQGLKRRYAKEKRFQWLGRIAVSIGFLLVAILLIDIVSKGLPAFSQTWIKLDMDYRKDWLRVESEEALENARWRSALRKSIYQMFPEVKKRKEKRKLTALFSTDAEFAVKRELLANPQLLGSKHAMWVLADDDVDTYLKQNPEMSEPAGRINEQQVQWLRKLAADGRIESRFNWLFFTNGDSRDPELAGIRGALSGTLLTMLVTLILSFPLGVAAALYLEEFAPQNRLTDLIEINVNNLAAVPSIVFGLLGLAVVINWFGLPRSAPLVGGIVLTLMTLPTIIIASRASIKAVPPSIREAAYGLGASKMQVAFGHVLPLAMPGIMTGTIIGMAQALGETAPLLMIGMVAFIVDIPSTITDPATVLPVQIYLWADSPEKAFVARTSAAIMVLLGFLMIMNASAAYLRRRFEKQW